MCKCSRKLGWGGRDHTLRTGGEGRRADPRPRPGPKADNGKAKASRGAGTRSFRLTDATRWRQAKEAGAVVTPALQAREQRPGEKPSSPRPPSCEGGQGRPHPAILPPATWGQHVPADPGPPRPAEGGEGGCVALLLGRSCSLSQLFSTTARVIVGNSCDLYCVAVPSPRHARLHPALKTSGPHAVWGARTRTVSCVRNPAQDRALGEDR